MGVGVAAFLPLEAFLATARRCLQVSTCKVPSPSWTQESRPPTSPLSAQSPACSGVNISLIPESVPDQVSSCPRQAMPHPPRPPNPDLLGARGIISSSPGLGTGHLMLTAVSFIPAAGSWPAGGPSCSEGLDPHHTARLDTQCQQTGHPRRRRPPGGLVLPLFTSS